VAATDRALSLTTDLAGEVAEKATERAETLTKELRKRADGSVEQLADRAGDVGEQALERAGELGEQLADRAEKWRDEALDRWHDVEDELPVDVDEVRDKARTGARKAQIALWEGIRALLSLLFILPKVLVRALGLLSDAIEDVRDRGADVGERVREATDAVPPAASTRKRSRRRTVAWTAAGFVGGAVTGWALARRQGPAVTYEPPQAFPGPGATDQQSGAGGTVRGFPARDLDDPLTTGAAPVTEAVASAADEAVAGVDEQLAAADEALAAADERLAAEAEELTLADGGPGEEDLATEAPPADETILPPAHDGTVDEEGDGDGGPEDGDAPEAEGGGTGDEHDR
jgi:hypothetical protein